MNRYTLVTDWQLAAPIERVWQALYDVAAWPQWWPYVQSVVEVTPGNADGVGAVRRYTWTSRLPYRLSFDMRSTIVQRPFVLEGEAQGELNGTGRWTLRDAGAGTGVRYDWSVSTSRPWMNALAPLLAPAFRWNHGQVMAAGARGLARHLGVAGSSR
jgi:uncharacterized protein YndB with AHSA1/START domain